MENRRGKSHFSIMMLTALLVAGIPPPRREARTTIVMDEGFSDLPPEPLAERRHDYRDRVVMAPMRIGKTFVQSAAKAAAPLTRADRRRIERAQRKKLKRAARPGRRRFT